ncbi:iron-sulfur cluster biosynthesis family protein [uncultured Lactobacillus sp.]|uniref:iron-sulfur cluster biosynthesis family protein n=1 Tax=uncultured Lactobacillus sp. TaxID=153152 RepID=UPI0026117974|nr:iron-sulfur cluster biosynthesis family protein [uncultured Lactobacillus sp.]
MVKMTIASDALKLLKKKDYDNYPLLLIVDGGGGDYSIEGGSCSLGADFSIIILDTRPSDPRYPILIQTDTDLKFYTSDYDLAFLGNNLILDIKDTTLRLRNDSGLLTGNVKLATASDLQKAAKRGQLYDKNC